jgi:hypothetical protein
MAENSNLKYEPKEYGRGVLKIIPSHSSQKTRRWGAHRAGAISREIDAGCKNPVIFRVHLIPIQTLEVKA